MLPPPPEAPLALFVVAKLQSWSVQRSLEAHLATAE